jgi:hypothetical protein
MSSGGFVARKIARQSSFASAKNSLASIARENLRELGINQPSSTDFRVFTDYRDKPVEFIQEKLGTKLTEQQIQIALALLESNKVAVKAGQKTGKSRLDVCLQVWWVATRIEGKGLITSASFEQVKDPLWSELTALWQQTNGKVFPEPALDPGTGVRWPDGRTIRGLSTNKRERAAGKSGAGLFIILDEASGIDAEIAEAFEGNTIGGGKLLATSNPTEASGFFFDCFNARSKWWEKFTLSARETPNYLTGRTVIPGLAGRNEVDQLVEAYGEGSPFVDVRVDGNFPKQAHNAVIPLGLVEAARRRWGTVEPSQLLDIGVDVARFGDDLSVAQPIRGYVAGTAKAVNGYNTIEVAGMVLEMVKNLRGPGDRCRIKIDSGGGYGGGVADLLREWIREDPRIAHAVTVVEVNASEASLDKLYDLRRDELWFGIRTWLKDGGTFQRNEQLERELIAPTYDFTARNGRMKVEPKKEIKKRLGRSPDYADAFALAIWGQAANDNALQDDAELLDDDEPQHGFG